jgi:hypothetical protein
MEGSKLDDLVRRLAAAVPDNLAGNVAAMRRELETNFRATLRAGLGRMNLVTREEFDVQQAVLRRTREKLEALERQVKALEDGSSG